MLFVIGGASGSGKTLNLLGLALGRSDLIVRDEDVLGFYEDFDCRWRHATTAYFVREALLHQECGRDTVLGGQLPLGEVLAAPDAEAIDGIAACLLDCDDAIRIARGRIRGGPAIGRRQVEWAAFLRGHAVDPGHDRGQLRCRDDDGTMRWERWWEWKRGDPRWDVEHVDTTDLTPDQSLHRLTIWIAAQRALHAAGKLPLAADWWRTRVGQR